MKRVENTYYAKVASPQRFIKFLMVSSKSMSKYVNI